MDKETAREIHATLIDVCQRLDGTIVLAKQRCSEEDFKKYRRAVGAVMGEILLEILNPMYVEHPELKPPGME